VTTVVAVVALLAANAFFVAFEFALVASRRARLEQLAAEGRFGAAAALTASSSLSRHIAGVQVGVTMASLGLGAVGEPAIGRALESLAGELMAERAASVVSFVLALVIVVLLHGVLGELVPKRIALASAERALLVLAVPMSGFVRLMRPVIALLNHLAGAVLRVLRVPRRDQLMTAGTASELARLIDRSAERGYIEPAEHELLAGALAFRDRPVSAVMVPRDQVVATPLHSTPAQIESVLTRTGRTRVPLYGRDLDDAVGFVHAKDLVNLEHAARGRPLDRSLVRRMLLVRDTRPLGEVLAVMRRSRVHLAAVRDRDGALVGVITLEDVLEELVGQIADETDAGPPGATPSVR
jgi:CBS domain containing-hemolysin-like protein